MRNFIVQKNKLNKYRKLRVFITGATGLKGSWLLFWLKKINAQVMGIGLPPEKNNIIINSLKLDKSNIIHIQNINNFDETLSLIKSFKPDIIFHLAAQSIVSKSITDPLDTFRTNIIGSANLIEISKKIDVPLVMITSDKCYKNNEWIWAYRENDELGSSDPYSASKACAELVFASFFKTYYQNNKYLKIGTTRAGNVIGGGDMKSDRIIPDLFRAISARKPIKIRNPLSTRPWQHVLEPLMGYLTLGLALLEDKFKKDEIIPNWNFGPDVVSCKNVEYIIKYIINYLNIDISIIKQSKKFKEQNLLMLDSTKAKKELGWQTKMDINQSLEFTSDWYMNFYNEKNIYNFSNLQIEKYENL